jgi:hypothetical protein
MNFLKKFKLPESMKWDMAEIDRKEHLDLGFFVKGRD